MGHERIQLDDTPMSMLIKLAEGNPGGLNVMMQILEKGQSIDPDAAFGPFAHILGLDTFGIYGSRIWMLFKDVCKEQAVYALACLRAVQLGIMGSSVLDHAIDNRGEGLDVFATRRAVCERLPNFSKAI